MSLVDKVNKAEKYDWGKVDSRDPKAIATGFTLDQKEGICKSCFGRIVCPIINGIWYHKDSSWDIDIKDHQPIPASPVLQLFNIFMKPNSFKHDKVRTSKCKHSKWWSSVLEFPKLNEGFYGQHYYRDDYISLCGKVMRLMKRNRVQGEKATFETDSYNSCKKCADKLEKLEMITIVVKKGSQYSYHKSYNYKWLKKKLPKQFLIDEKKKYMKVLK